MFAQSCKDEMRFYFKSEYQGEMNVTHLFLYRVLSKDLANKLKLL